MILGANERARLLRRRFNSQGFDVRAIRPPTVPEGTARLRISINVNLSERIVDSFVDALCAASS